MKTNTKLGLKHEISRTRQEIAKSRMKLARLTRRLPREEIRPNFVLRDWNSKDVRLSDLFGDKDDLIVVHNMGKHCPYCTLWADGFNGLAKHFENRSAFVVVSPDHPATQEKFAKSRGWKFRMVSGRGSSFIKEMGFETNRNGFLPGVSVFHRDGDGRIFRVGKDRFGPGDDYCIIWHFFDLLHRGSNGWEPKFSY